MTTKSWIMALLLCTSLPATAIDMNADEQEVWSLEQAYWEYVSTNDVAGYLTLWDERFVGWPSFSGTTMEKDSISGWIPPLHEDPALAFAYELAPEAVRSFGDVVVAHYLVRGFHRDADGVERTGDGFVSRITHTWQRRGDTWQVITGMSCDHAPVDEAR